jgi:hypothetical protein
VATASFAAATRRKTDTANLFRTIGLPSTDRPTVRGSPEFRASVSHRSLEFKGEDGWGFYAEASGSSALGVNAWRRIVPIDLICLILLCVRDRLKCTVL